MSERKPDPSAETDRTGQTIEQIRAAAELYLLETVGLPSYLLPSSRLPRAVTLLSAQIRTLAVRRTRLVQRARVAAVSLHGGAIAIVEKTTEGGPVTAWSGRDWREDVTAVEILGARAADLDEAILDLSKLLLEVAGELGVEPETPPWEK
jgi:hypothetical protein